MLLLDSSGGTSRFLDNSRHDPTFPTNQASRSGGHNFTANGCCAGGSLAFRRAIERTLACGPRRSTGRAKGGGVPRGDVSDRNAAPDPHRLERGRTRLGHRERGGKRWRGSFNCRRARRQRGRKPKFPRRRRSASGETGALFGVTFDASADRSESISQDRGDDRFLWLRKEGIEECAVVGRG